MKTFNAFSMVVWYMAVVYFFHLSLCDVLSTAYGSNIESLVSAMAGGLSLCFAIFNTISYVKEKEW